VGYSCTATVVYPVVGSVHSIRVIISMCTFVFSTIWVHVHRFHGHPRGEDHEKRTILILMALCSRTLPRLSQSVFSASHTRSPQRSYASAPKRPDIRICFIGDSFTNGAGDDTALGFPGRLCSDLRTGHGLDITCYNLGIRRDTSTDVLDRWEREVNVRLKRGEHSGRLVFSFGTNDNVIEDGEKRVNTIATLANAKSILVRAKQLWPTVMLGPPWTSVEEVDDGNGPLSRKLGQLCKEIDVPFLALYGKMEGNEVWAREAEAGDGIHPNSGGYGLIAKVVAEWDAWERFVRNGK
jgi:acyl-CoA thioesterase-1